jgi:carnitine-CoA ligase
MVPALVAGASVVLARRFSVSNFWKEVGAMGVTQFNLMSSMTNFLWSQPPSAAEREHKVRQCMLVPTPSAYYDEFKKRFNIETIHSVYALTDAGVVTITSRLDPDSKRMSAGRADRRFDVRIFDDNDVELAPGQTGEIVIRNREPWVMPRGYYNDAERTLAAWQNLWLHTGDRGYMDQDGYLYFVDRKKDAIRRRGENISSYEVEQLVLSHPAIKDVAAYPIPAEESEDEVAISVVRREGHGLTEEQLIEHCRDNMPYFMVPRYVEFLDALPLTMTGKVEKYKLVQDFAARKNDVWDREQHGIKITRHS